VRHRGLVIHGNWRDTQFPLHHAVSGIVFFSLGNVALITGPIATESAPVGLISAAIGIVVASGEIFGGGIAPVIGGAIAQHQGIQNILWMPLVGVLCGALISLALKENGSGQGPRRATPGQCGIAQGMT
jgi:hypothetical protein